MPPPTPKPSLPANAGYKTIAEEWRRAQRVREIEQSDRAGQDIHAEQQKKAAQQRQLEAVSQQRKSAYERRWAFTLAFWIWMLCLHAIGLYLFTSGFMLTRMVLDEASSCTQPPIESLAEWEGKGSVDGGCWHPKTFDKAVIILIDALRYDFTVPVPDGVEADLYHDAFPFLYESAVQSPANAFLRPFIADPPTATLQRLKGLTTGTLPVFIDIGSNFAGTAIEEDSLLSQLRDAGKRTVHLGDDTWWSLFPGYFDANVSRAYDSFNVWDLHTVDNGVLEHIYPLMQEDQTSKWDVLIGHFLGVDHAGHRYGPSHAAMAAKLRQMDQFVRNLTELIDDKTLLVVMGDHGMDAKGDHGGESDDEVEAALWMYSKRPLFGRTAPAYDTPPATAKIRPVNQIDLVPTLALLLGIPIPYNNLGGPIEEAFVGRLGSGKISWADLAAATRTTAATIKRYQASYLAHRGGVALDTSAPQDVPLASRDSIFRRADAAAQAGDWLGTVEGFSAYQESTLAACRALWARFDLAKMATGIVVVFAAVLVLLLCVGGGLPDASESGAEDGVAGMSESNYQVFSRQLLRRIIPGALAGAGLTAGLSMALDASRLPPLDWSYMGAGAAIGSMMGALTLLLSTDRVLRHTVPRSPWTWLSIVFILLQSIGFASNSYTIWEDSILLFFITTFGAANLVAAFRVPDRTQRWMAATQATMFIILGRAASFSKLCREEQMPYCRSTYYASATSSTSALWQLAIPFCVAVALPSVIKSFLVATNSYEGLAPSWIGYCFRVALLSSAGFWLLDAADNGNWLPGVEEGQTLKTIRVYVAQGVLALAFVVGSVTFPYAPPSIRILKDAPGSSPGVVPVLGLSNIHGARYILLVANLLAGCILLSKPMGGGALSLFAWQMLLVPELVSLNGLGDEVIGPVMFAVLGNFYFFKTGHQAVLSTIQWDSAFIPLFAIRYPWAAICVALNTFAGQILAAVAVPLVVLWRAGPRRKGVLEAVHRALAAFVSYFAVETLATMMWAGHLRRHLMLYRVFSPRFMTAATVLLLVDLVGIVVTLPGVRSNTLAIMFVFEWFWTD